MIGMTRATFDTVTDIIGIPLVIALVVTLIGIDVRRLRSVRVGPVLILGAIGLSLLSSALIAARFWYLT
jgi:hypothetical protein